MASALGKMAQIAHRVKGFTLLAAAFFALAAPAHADSTFLIQLGTSDSEKSAMEKWDAVKTKNADLVGSLTLHIAEVALPPGNEVSYRTQVGPVSTRGQATSLCGTLQSRGVDCYVVETAMFASESAPDQPIKDDTMPSSVAPVKPHHKAVAAAEDTLHADDPDYIPPPNDSGPVIISGGSTSVAQATPPSATVAEMAEMPIPAPAPAPVVVEKTPVEKAPVEKEVAAAEPTPREQRESTITNHTPASNSRMVTGSGNRPTHYLETPKTKAAPPVPAPVPPVQVAAVPAPPREQSPGFFSRLFGSSPPKVAAAQGVTGSVNVAEAVRVPLSTEAQPAQKIVPVLPATHPVAGAPSESTARTFWAQVSYFRDEAQALTFYRQFSAAYPQYAQGLRIRITRPFAGIASAPRVSLRVGPFIGTQDVRSICGVATRWQARCTVVRDLGASAALDGSTAPAPRAADTRPLSGSYFTQLGTYRSEQEAWDAWRELSETHKKVFSKARPSVVTPPLSSATAGAFRLRAGPMNLSNASTMCAKLQSGGLDCVVVNAQ